MNKDKYFSSIIKWCGYLLIVFAAFNIYGWFKNIVLFKSVLRDLPSMKLNSAVAFLVFGIALVVRKKSVFLGRIFAALVFLISAFSLVQDLFDVNWGIDELIVKDLDGKAMGLAHPGRMAVSTAICFILIGSALFFSNTKNQRIQQFNQFYWHLVTLIAILAFVGYAYRVPVFYRLSFLSSMAIHTATLFFLVSLAGSLIHSDVGITGLLNGNRAGNMLAKKLIPSMAFLIFLLGYLRILSHEYELISDEMGIALLSTSFFILTIISISIVAKQLNDIDSKRDKAERDLQYLNSALEVKITERTNELKELEEQFEFATSKTNIGIGILNMATNKVTINSYFSEYLLGIEGSRVIERDQSRNIMHQDEVARHFAVFNNSLKTGEPYEIEVRSIRHDGAERMLRFNGHIKVDKNGNPNRVITLVRDITEEKAIQEEIRISQERLEIATSKAGIGVYEIDVATGLIKINHTEEKILGIKSENLTITRDFLRSLVHPDDKEYTQKAAAELAKTQTAFSVQFRIIRPDGEIRNIQGDGIAIKDARGGNLRYIGIHIDVTERLQAEQKILKISQTLKAATEGSKIGVWDWNVVTNELIWDDRMLLLYGLKSSEFTGAYAAWENGVHPVDQKDAIELIQKAVKGEADFDTEFRVVWPNGSIHYIKGNGIVQRDTEGKPLRMLGTNWDITSIKENEKQLLEKTKELELKNKELEQFAFIASHDLQEPLRTITSLIHVVESNQKESIDEITKKSFVYIREATQRMKNLISDLLEYSKVGRNSALKEVDCNELIQSVQRDMNNSIVNSGAKISVGELPKIKAYETEIRSLFQNILSNAIKYRKADVPVEIAIKAEDRKGYWEFSFADNGIGIDPIYKEKVFEIFQRLHRKNEYEGTGIGLAQCKKIIDLHKGEIWLDSQVQKGSTFYFTINKNL